MVLLCRAEALGLGRYSRFILSQPGFVQALAMSVVPPLTLFSARAVRLFIERKAIEPGLAFCDQLVRYRQTLGSLGAAQNALPTQVRNVLFEIGVIPGKPTGVDPMAEILSKRYGTPNEAIWRPFFAGEYLYALQQLTQAEKLFDMGRSQWLNYQNSFNHAAFLALQEHLNRLALSSACKTSNKHGELIKFGVLLGSGQTFEKAHPLIAGAFRSANNRRNKLPSSHPYDEKTGARNRALRRQEQGSLVARLATAYTEIVNLCLANGVK